MRFHLLFIPFLAGIGSVAAAQPSIRFDIDATVKRPISPYIYGVNHTDWAPSGRRFPLSRIGGNRWTAYNWENNASNAGSDWFHQNDSYLGGGDTPGEAVRSRVAESRLGGGATIVTLPMAGYVAADKNGGGDVNQTPNYLQNRFRVSVPAKSGTLIYPPSTADGAVYQNEFVAWLETQFPRATGGEVLYSLDNEPDLWASTHARIHPNNVGYAELVDRTVALASAVKSVAPTAQVLGPVNYGWSGYVRLQNAPDHNNRDFLDFFLGQMKAAETQAGKRLLDILDLHWYPEAYGDGFRITGEQTTAGVVQARIQAPRSLWDPTYMENSWICRDWLNGPIRLIPRMREKIAAHYPGTKLAFTEYNYGGGGHISGAIAQADVLGIFGREGVYAANLWELSADQRFIYGAFDCFLRYDGKNRFGDLNLAVANPDPVNASCYASLDSRNPSRMVVIAINKSHGPLNSNLALNGFSYRSIRVFRLSGTDPAVKFAYGATYAAKRPLTNVAVSLPPMSINVVELRS